MTTEGLFTRADYRALPEGFPAQLIDGWLVKQPAPSFSHQGLVTRLVLRLARCVDDFRILPAPVDIEIDEHNVLQPDIAVLRAVRDRPARGFGPPLLVLEVASPSSRAKDREVKSGKFLAAGVGEVWLVDPTHGTIEVRGIGEPPRSVRGAEAAASRVLPGLQLVPDDLFDGLAALGERDLPRPG